MAEDVFLPIVCLFSYSFPIQVGGLPSQIFPNPKGLILQTLNYRILMFYNGLVQNKTGNLIVHLVYDCTVIQI